MSREHLQTPGQSPHYITVKKKEIYEVKLYGCYILELLAHSQMRMLAEIARVPERNF